MAEEALLRITLAVIVGTLAAIVYSLRILVLMERRVARIEEHIDTVAHKILKEELTIENRMKKKR
ncbi:MAG: hypothetical protein AABY13_02270 [Nanoarchaeota archaeon]